MNAKPGARGALNIHRWASYTLAGAATLAAASEANAAGAIFYSGPLNTPVGSSPVLLRTLIAEDNPGAGTFGQFSHQSFIGGASGSAMVKINGAVNGQVAGFLSNPNRQVAYPSHLAANTPLPGMSGNTRFLTPIPVGATNFLAVAGPHNGNVRTTAEFKSKGNGEYLAFEFNNGAGEQYGWARVNMTSGPKLNSFTVVDYAYGSPGQAITIGQTQAVGTSWTGGKDDTWANGGNWSTGLAPGATSATTSTDTAQFASSVKTQPVVIDANRNLQNITFDGNSSAIVIGTTSGNPLLLTEGGVIQIVSFCTTPQTINAPLVLEGTAGVSTNSYLMADYSGGKNATLSVGGTIAAAASGSLTTLNLAGANYGANTLGGAISDGAGGAMLALDVQGGKWSLTAADTYSGGTTIESDGMLQLSGTVSSLTPTMNVVNSGALIVSSTVNQNVGTVTGSGTVAVNSGSLTAYQIVQSSLTIGAGATVTLAPSGSGSTSKPTGPNNVNFSSTLASLTIAGSPGAWTGTLDIGNNGLVIEYGTAADPYAQLDDMIRSGFDDGHWDGTGITSSLGRAAADSHTPLNIGLLDFTPGTGNYSNTTFIVFSGQTITTNAILIRLAYMDDINLFGDMSAEHAASDALIFAANYGSGTTWSVGDLEHTGLVESADALLFAANYTVGLSSLDGTTGNEVSLGGGAAGVPEPASLGLLAIGAAGLLAVRRARKRKSRPEAECSATVELFVPDLDGGSSLPVDLAEAQPGHSEIANTAAVYARPAVRMPLVWKGNEKRKFQSARR